MKSPAIKRRVLDISLAHGIGHVGSNLGAVDVLSGLYANRKPNDIVILSAGHCGLALYCVLEAFGQLPAGLDAEAVLNRQGEQPHLKPAWGIHCTTGSLGMGITVAVGYALADLNRRVFVVLSDGECAEGCVWESLAYIGNSGLRNIAVHVLANGYSAISKIDLPYLETRLRAFLPEVVIHHVGCDLLPNGIQSHYKNLTPESHAAAVAKLAPP